MLLQTRVKLELLANNSPWPAPISWLPKRGDSIRSLDIVAACMLGVSSAVHTGGNARAHASPRPSLHWHIFAFLLGPPSARYFSAYCPVLFLLRRACLRIITFCTCPPRCGGRSPTGSCVIFDLFVFSGMHNHKTLPQRASQCHPTHMRRMRSCGANTVSFHANVCSRSTSSEPAL